MQLWVRATSLCASRVGINLELNWSRSLNLCVPVSVEFRRDRCATRMHKLEFLFLHLIGVAVGLSANQSHTPQMRSATARSASRLRTTVCRARLMIAFGLATAAILFAASSANAGTQWLKVSAGGQHSCGITVYGAAKCWGDNQYGQLGNNESGRSYTPVQVAGLTGGVTDISAGFRHTCAVVSGSAKCWGSNEISSGLVGQLGSGHSWSSSSPVQVFDLDSGVTRVSAGFAHSCAVVNGAARCWGSNVGGQLGDGSNSTTLSPIQVIGLTAGVAEISAGGSHSCAIVSGAAKCWGSNTSWQIGDGTGLSNSVPFRSPQQVFGLDSGVTAIDAGAFHTCGIAASSVRCWGSQYALPNEQVSDTSGAAVVSAGSSHSCAVIGGGVKCWGSSSYGQLGDGAAFSEEVPATFSLTPVQAFGLAGSATSVSAGDNHSCAVASGGAMCWGHNSRGQIGSGSESDSIQWSVFPRAVGSADIQLADTPWSKIGDVNSECRGIDVIGVRGSRASPSEVSPNVDPQLVRSDQVLAFMEYFANRIRYTDNAQTEKSGFDMSDALWVKYDAAAAQFGAGTSDSAWRAVVALWVSPPVGAAATVAASGAAIAYTNSVEEGVSRLEDLVNQRTSFCASEGKPSTIVLVGHSQGAQVIGRAIDRGLITDQVSAAALMGDPTFSIDKSGTSIWFPDVTGGRDYVPSGAIHERDNQFPAQPAVFSACRFHDPVCTGQWLGDNDIAEHSKYPLCTKFRPSGQPGDWLPPLALQLAERIANGPLRMPLTSTARTAACDSSGEWASNGLPEGRRSSGNARLQPMIGTESPTYVNPVAVLPAGDVSIKPGAIVNLSASASFDLTGQSLSYEWDTDGDGDFEVQSESPILFRAYSEPPNGEVSLRVTNESLESSTTSMAITVSDDAVGEPAAPTNVRASTSPGAVVLSWDPPTSDGGSSISGYRVIDALHGYTLAITDGTTHSVTIDELVPGSTVALKVRAANPKWIGPYSNASNPVTIPSPNVDDITEGSTGSTADAEQKIPASLSIRAVRLSADKATIRITLAASAAGTASLRLVSKSRGKSRVSRLFKRELQPHRSTLIKVRLPAWVRSELTRKGRIRVHLSAKLARPQQSSVVAERTIILKTRR